MRKKARKGDLYPVSLLLALLVTSGFVDASPEFINNETQISKWSKLLNQREVVKSCTDIQSSFFKNETCNTQFDEIANSSNVQKKLSMNR
ncbi:MAG: hypothetical protein M9962_12395 [Oligoflexia bacterium]|nr:hypothetical protein [Oligoflexia bacterium]